MICNQCKKEYNGRNKSKYCSVQCRNLAYKEYDIFVNRKRKIEFVINDNGCHICTSHKSGSGYPMIRIDTKLTMISRYIYESKYGKIGKGVIIRHKCDNPLCINVDHLESGTHQDNMNDMKQRSIRGSLTKNDVLYIRNNDLTAIEAKELFNVNICTLQRVISRKSWKNI